MMEIYGGSERNVDRVVWVDDLTVKTLIALIERLEDSAETEQFLFREAELDGAFRQADADVRLAARQGADAATMTELDRVRAIVFRAHDLVGYRRVAEAAQELKKVIDIKIGLDNENT